MATRDINTLPSVEAYRLAEAVMGMTRRYGESEMKAAYVYSCSLVNPTQKAEHLAESQRYNRAAQRRYKAIRRLTEALRDGAR